MTLSGRAGGLISAATGVALLLGCAGGYTPPLTQRGVPADERRDYVIQNGYGIPEPVKQAFLDGYVVEGMSKEMVYHLFGAPDRAANRDSQWEYVNRKGQLITGVHFKNDKIERVDGDPSGGANAAASTPLP
jgi:hypothetical protein